MKFTAWGYEYEGTEQFSRRTGEGPEDGFSLHQLENGEYIAVPWACSDAAWVSDSQGNPVE